MADDALDHLSARILGVLAETPVTPVSLPRLGKWLGLAGSTLMRHLGAMGGSAVGARVGPGWIEVLQDEGRWRCALLPAGAQRLARHLGTGCGNGPPP